MGYNEETNWNYKSEKPWSKPTSPYKSMFSEHKYRKHIIGLTDSRFNLFINFLLSKLELSLVHSKKQENYNKKVSSVSLEKMCSTCSKVTLAQLLINSQLKN